MSKMITGGLLLLFLVGLWACASEELVADADGDALIVSKITGQGANADTIYGLALHAFGNKDFSRVEVTTPGGEKILLSPYNSYAYDFYYEDEAGFGQDLPVAGAYSFACTYRSGETSEVVDELSNAVIYPVHVTQSEYNATNKQIELKWDQLENADYFVIYMQKTDGDVVFVSQSFDGEATGFNISPDLSNGKWLNGYTPTTGTVYSFIINAYRYEGVRADLNLQAKSIATTTAAWGAR